jgi:hypothetical protein
MGDSEVGVSAMTNLGEMDDAVDPGIFHLLDIGVAWEMEEFCTIYFCGLHFHGGTPPVFTPEPTTNLAAVPSCGRTGSRNTRLIAVAYGSAAQLDGDAVIAVGATPKGTVVAIGPEMKGLT